MPWDLYVRAFLYLLLVLGLIVVCTWLLRFYGAGRVPARSNKRLKVIEALAIDPRRRLVTIQWDDQEHLLLLSGNRDTVIASKPAPARFAEQLPQQRSLD